MVKAWIADVSALLEEECYRRYYEALPDFRKEKADRIKVPAGRAQSVGVWALCEKIKEKYSLDFLDMEKAVKGMGLPLDAFEIRLGSPPKLIRKPEEFEEPYYYCEYERKGLPYKMAVCSTDSDIDSEILTEFELR